MALETRQTPLIECELKDDESGIVRVGERPFLGHLNFRADAEDKVSIEIVEEMFGFSLPLNPNQAVRSGAGIAVWLAPDEWLIIHQDESGSVSVDPLQMLLEGRHAAVTDVSSGQTLLYLYGSHSREVLARGCPLDLHPRQFKPGDSAQTHFEHVPITLWLDTSTPDPELKPWINLVVRRSFADYIWRRLEDTAAAIRATVPKSG